VTAAYINYSLSEAGLLTADMTAEIAATRRLAETSEDSYLLALASATLLNLPAERQAGMAAAVRLARQQEADGVFKKADHSITRSGGTNLFIETTALAVIALLKSGEHAPSVDRAVEWLHKNRGGFGQWGATQATVLALKALTLYDRASRRTPGTGSVQLLVNGQLVGSERYEAGRREPIQFTALASAFRPGKNTIEVVHDGVAPLPYSVAVEYRSARPASSPEATVEIRTELEKPEVKMGESVRLIATVTNKKDQGQPMTLARVGLPGGLSFQTWQLKELRDKGLIGFYETRPREVILYFRDLKPSETRRLPLDLLATVPGSYTAPASSAYLYYNDEHKSWTAPVRVQVSP
jgi:hypothetical protein